VSVRLPFALDARGAPLLMPGGAPALLDELAVRRGAFVPEWRGNDETDAGTALARLWSAQAGAAIDRLQQLPDKLVRECLSAAGVGPRPQRPARALIAFKPDMKRLAGPLPVPQGFQLTSARADGGKGLVTWETEDELVLPPLELAEAFAFDGEHVHPLDLSAPFHPFGERPALGAALYLGFAAGGDPGTALSLGLVPVDLGAVGTSGGRPAPSQPEPVLRWEALNPARGFERGDVIADGTNRFAAEGVLRLALPRGWGPSRPGLSPKGDPLLWLRVRLVSGAFARIPQLQSLIPHAVHAAARQTWRDQETSIQRGRDGVRVNLGRPNVEPGSVVLTAIDPLGGVQTWSEVGSLAGQDGNARVFVLDSAQGILHFGDGRDGAMLPTGLNRVTLRAFATVAGAESAVAADAITKPVRQLAGLAGLSNPAAASGGAALESDAAAIQHGPALVKARGRAVTAGDVALLALSAQGASITRAWALGGVDASLGGAVRPGAIGVFVIPARRASDPADEPVLAGSEALAAVARYLAGSVGAALARVTVGNPKFHRIRIEANIACRAGADLGAAAAAAEAAINSWLDPESDGGGLRQWRLGDMIRYNDLVRLVLGASADILSVPDLVVVVDGLRHPACRDLQLSAFGLPWPDRHEFKASLAEEGA